MSRVCGPTFRQISCRWWFASSVCLSSRGKVSEITVHRSHHHPVDDAVCVDEPDNIQGGHCVVFVVDNWISFPLLNCIKVNLKPLSIERNLITCTDLLNQWAINRYDLKILLKESTLANLVGAGLSSFALRKSHKAFETKNKIGPGWDFEIENWKIDRRYLQPKNSLFAKTGKCCLLQNTLHNASW